jgi:hypothetical protein
LCEEDVNKMVHEYILSGDYKGATDTLDPEWSAFAFEAITRRVYKHATDDNSYGDAIRRTLGLLPMLTGHRMSHGKVEFDQLNGQLMGSFLSFPILCILNAAVNRLYLNPSLDTPIEDLPLLVNGDDVLMSKDTPFDGWAEHISMIGLKPSLGKNYVHTHVCCLNSEFYRRKTLTSKFERSYPWRINLVYGAEKRMPDKPGLFGKHTSHGPSSTLGAMARTLLEHHQEATQALLLSEFIRNNLDSLKSTNRSWWVPEELGGLGLPLSRRTVALVTPLARLVATYLMTRPSPEDTQLYAARDSPDCTPACKAWMSASKRLMISKGYKYEWLTDEERLTPCRPPIGLRGFVGFGSISSKIDVNKNAYHKLLKLVLKAKGFLSPCLDDTLIEFANKPRKAGWVRRPLAPKEDISGDDTLDHEPTLPICEYWAY